MSTPRFLRSKRLRALLWYAADGKCQGCGTPLPDEWHADHVTPWTVTQTTNIHDMQALCPACNLIKGDRMLRPFQQEFVQLLETFRRGMLQTQDLYVLGTTGSGKSFLPPLAMRLLPQMAQKICWVVPRLALGHQAERLLTKRDYRPLWGHGFGLRFNHDNRPDPSRSYQGYITTYQSIVSNPQLHSMEFDRFPYILVLDEPHHVRDLLHDPSHPDLKWKRAIAPLIDKAVLRIFMSGTFERHNREAIAFLPYERTHEETYTLAFPPEKTITYMRGDALRDGSIVPLHFSFSDGAAQWVDKRGETQTRESFDELNEEEEERDMVRVVLETEFAHELLEKALTSWYAHRVDVYNKAKILVVAPTIAHAKDYCAFINTRHEDQVDYATYDDTRKAQENIERFKNERSPHLDMLVTVGMAYEGLDVPEITHLVCLTNFRSKPWLEQCFGRACRKAPGKEYGFVFMPDDPLMKKVAEAIIAEQEAVIFQQEPQDTTINGGGRREPKDPPQGTISMQSKLGAERVIDGTSGIGLSRDITEQLNAVANKYGLQGHSKLILYQAFQELQHHNPEAWTMPPFDDLPPSVKESRLRQAIENYGRKYDIRLQQKFGTFNKNRLERTGMSRTAMNLEELLNEWAVIQEEYPLPEQEKPSL